MISETDLEDLLCSKCPYIKSAEHTRGGEMECGESCPAGIPFSGDSEAVLVDGALFCEDELRIMKLEGI